MEDKYNAIFNGLYRGKKVLVTGHTGFKGSWLSLWLKRLGAKVAGFSAYLPSEPCNFEVLNLEDKVTHFVGDVCNQAELKEVFKTFRPEIVFHLAAQPIVRKAYDAPKLTFETNVLGTINVLECIRENSFVKVAVIITSDKCYENVSKNEGYKETDRLGGEDPYSASKACAEIAASSYIYSYFTGNDAAKIVTTRAGNVIGGGDWATDRIVPDAIRSWIEDKELIVRNPKATRPWQHVLEPLSGYLWLGAKLLEETQCLIGEAFNFGPEDGVVKSVGELVNVLKEYFGKGSWKHVPCEQAKKEAILLQLSCDKAFSLLAWKPALDFAETIKMTAQWYKKYYDKQDIYDFSCLQIEEYIKKAQAKDIVWAGVK